VNVPATGADSLEQVAREVRGCPRCRLALTRTNAVPGAGRPDADLLLVGEAPGRTEDEVGLPFQGLSGRFLNGALSGLGLTRDDVFVTSVNKCRPPKNRNPRRDEMTACAPYLERQMRLISPLVVLAMGGTAAARLHPESAGRAVKVAELRGQVHPLGPDRALVVTYHPASAMRFPKQRQPFLDDLEQAARLASLLG
jgi:DNA polymerase